MNNWLKNLNLQHKSDEMVAVAHYVLVTHGFEYETDKKSVPLAFF